jgi:pimeloyl-ACP methyl ester carboxylesterase
LLNYFAATLDDWDPLVANGLACEREVILFDNAGVGSSTGDAPPTVAAMTKDCVDFCRSLDLMTFDVMGFSLGGMIAQQLVQDHPDMIRRMILLGAGPCGGEGMTFTELSADELDDPVALLMGAFFTPSKASQAAGRAYIEPRTAMRRSPRRRQAPSWRRSASGAPFPRRIATRCWTGSASPPWSCMGTRTSSSRRSTPSFWRSTCLTPSS